MSSDKKPLVKRVQAPYYFIKKRKGNEPFLFEELISFLRLHFRDNDIYFYDAKKSQEFVKALRLAFDVVHDDGDGDRLSKIEEIYFYGSSSSGYHIMDKEEDKDPKRDTILDPDLKNDTMNRLIEDLTYYFPLIPLEGLKHFSARLLVGLLTH